MESNQEILKATIINAKTELETRTYNHLSIDKLSNIEMKYSCKIGKIIYKGEIIESELIDEINTAIDLVKIKMSQEYTAVLAKMGIKI